MAEILAVLISFPAVFFTVVTSFSLLYWLFVILGAVDIDSLGGAAGAKEGALDGVVKGTMEGAAGAAKGAFEGAHEGVGDGLDHGDIGGEAGWISTLNLRHAPVTVIVSFFALFGLLLTGLYGLTFGIPGTLLGIPIFLGASVLSLLMTSVAVRPIAPLFKPHRAKTSKDAVGKIATISTGKVTDRFGQATLEDGGAGLILEVRDPDPNELKRGDKVLLLHYDAEKEAFEVEKLPDEFEPPKRRIAATEEVPEDPEEPPPARGEHHR